MLRRRAAIARADAVEFRVPAAGRHRDGSAYNTLIRLNATVRERPVQGVGEASRRGRAVTGDSQAGSWRFLEAALERLHGWRISTRRQRVRPEIAAMMGDLRRLAADTSHARGPEPPYRGTLAGLDIALVDLAAKATDVPLAEFLVGRRRPGYLAVARVSARLPGRQLRTRLASAADHPVIKFVDLADGDGALDAVSAAVRVLGAGTPLWLDLAGQLAQPDAHKLIEALADRIRSGELPRHVVVQRPIGVSDPDDVADLAELQAAADAGVPPDAMRPGVVIMADTWSREDARALAEAGVRGLDLNLQRLGGTLATLDVVRDLRSAKKDVRIGLSTVAQVTGFTAHALVELGAALPTLNYLELPDVVEPPVDEGFAPDAGQGLGIGATLAPVVGLVTRRVEVPHVPPRPLVYGQLRVNEFDIERLRGFASASWGIPLTSHLFERAALARGLDTIRLRKDVVVADHALLPEPIGFANRRSGWTGVAARKVVDDKELSRRILRAAGAPTPRGAAFRPDGVEPAVEFAQSLGVPVVVKPRRGSLGIGVATDLRSEAEVRSAISACRRTKFGGGDFLVEEYVTGNDYRCIVVGDRVVSVVYRRPAFVVGDGRSSVVDLVLQKNMVKLRNPHGCTRLIRLGRDAAFWLERQSLGLDDVPGDGCEIRLSSAANGSLGADPIEVVDETHESMRELAVRATHAIPGMDHCGVDIIGDHRRSVDEHPATVIEVNTGPGTLLNHFPMFGNPRDVSSEYVVRSCELAGFTPPEPTVQLAVRIEAFGVVQGVGYRQWFAGLAAERQLAGSIRNLPSGGVEAYIAGATEDVAAVASRAFVGPRRAFVSRVTTTHVAEVHPADRFEVYA